MTEHSMSEDNQARLAALAARRQAPTESGAHISETPRAATNARTDATARPRRSRRRHAAAGGRVLAVGLSASALLLLTSVLAQTGQPAAGPTTAPAPVLVRVVLTNGSGSSTAAPAAPVVAAAPVAAKATATTRAS